MYKFFTALLVILAIAAALAVSMHVGLRLVTASSAGSRMGGEDNPLNSLASLFPQISPAESCYPFNWQTAERERLQKLLEIPVAPPQGTDALALARYAEYARGLDCQDANYEQAMQEGMRRDPQNALYHYLLAYRWISLSLEGDDPTNDTPAGAYDYRVKDRALLDRGMQELAAGMELPLNNRRYDLLSPQLDAMPEVRYWDEYYREKGLLAAVSFPEYKKLRKFAWVNGFYLSLLLDEGKRRKAEPFLHTGERLAVQLVEPQMPTLVGMLVGLAIHDICERSDPVVCRQYGRETEAAEIERRFQVVSGRVQAWRESMKDKPKRLAYSLSVKEHGGLLASIMLPVFGNEQLVAPQSLHPSRLVEFTFFTELALSLLPLLFVGFLFFSALKYWRWRWALIGQEAPPHDMRLSGADWARVLLLGVLLPLALYAAVVYLPALSRQPGEVTIAIFALLLSALVLLIVLLIAPATLAANSIWRRSLAAGIIEVHRPGVGRFMRGLSSLLSLAWAYLFMRSLLALPVMAALWLAATSLLPDNRALLGGAWEVQLTITAVLVFVALLPVFWERHHLECARHFLALSRAMIPVYAVLALCTAALYPALLKLESHYLRQDTVMTTMRTADAITATRAEGRLVLELQQSVLDGAKQLENETPDHRR